MKRRVGFHVGLCLGLLGVGVQAEPESPQPPNSLDASEAVHEGNRLLTQGEAAKALELYSQAQQQKPDARELAFVQGLGHYALGEYDAARERFQAAVAGRADALADDALYSEGATYHAQALANMQDAEQANALPVINGGSADDHPTQALADLYTIHRELGGIDGCTVAVVGRLEHRNVSALLMGLAAYENVKVLLLPSSGKVSPEIRSYCDGRGVQLIDVDAIDALAEADAVYLNGPRTVAHAQLLKSRNSLNLRIDESFMSMLRPHCVVMDPMQRSGDFEVEVTDSRLAFYRQSANALTVRMAVLLNMLAVDPGSNGVNDI